MTIGQDTVVELYLDEVWTDISSYVRADPGVEISFGVRGEAGTADPAECRLVVNNRDGRFTPKNGAGPWYGLLKRGLPLRVTHASDVRFVGEVSEFPSRWDPSGNDVWLPMVAAGPLRRLVRSSVVDSPLTSYFVREGLVDGGHATGYWPMEDAVGSTVLAPGVSGPSALIFDGSPDLAAADPGPASNPIPTWSGASAYANIPVTPGSTGFTVGFLLVMPTGGTATNARLVQVATNGTAAGWAIRYVNASGGQLRLNAYDTAGAQILDVGPFSASLDGTSRWVLLEVQDDGANVDYALTVINVGTFSGQLNSYQVTSPSAVFVAPGAEINTDVGIGQLAVGDIFQAFFSHDFVLALRGYAGESVEARMNRVAEELAGVDMTVLGDGSFSTMLGVQPYASPLDIMRDAEAADAGGILRDSINGLNQLVYMTRRARYNRTPTVEFDYAAGHLSPPLEPTDDDQLLANDVTVTRPEGSSARAVDTTSPLNSLPWPDGIGLYSLAPTLNVEADTQLPDLAGWLLALGTIDETRFPVLTVDLTRNPSLATAVGQLRPGYTVTVENLPVYSGADTVALHVLGWQERITSHRRVFELNCTPAGPYEVFEVEDAEWGRLDSDTTVTSEALDTTETGVDYTGDTWITTATRPGDFPFAIEVGGEVMTVTAGTSSTFTVTRSVNGVVKSHVSGVPVRLADPVYLAL